jgi:hypothetical protein
MSGERFKIGWGHMDVCAPGRPMESQKVVLVAYPGAKKIGIQITEGELRGYVIFVDEDAYVAVKQSGKPVNDLRVV